MKIFKSFSRVLALCFLLSLTNNLFAAQSPPEVTEIASSEQGLQPTSFDATAVETVQLNETKIDVPAPITLEPTSLVEWWQFIYALLTPLAVWLFGAIWPSSTKRELVTKATSVAIVILVVVLSFKGFTIATLSQAAIALIMQVFVYDKMYQPLGIDTAKRKSYSNQK